MHITILAGSPRQNSISKRVALHLQHLLSEMKDLETSFINMQEHALAPIQEVWTAEEKVDKGFEHIYRTMHQTDGFIVVSPEYNGGYSPTLKNFLDHFTKKAYMRKPWGIVTSSTGAMGGMRASQQLQLLGAGLFAIGSPRMLIVPHADKKFDEEGRLQDEGFAPGIQGFLDDFLWLAAKLRAE
jgi:NAD(P)H-dependent FMN reductase